MNSAVAPELPRLAQATPGRTLAVVAASTVLTLAAFVTPLATGIRTAADFGTGPAGQAWLLSAMSVGLAAALLVAGVGAADLGQRGGAGPRGVAADDLGQRRVFAAGLVVLGVGAGISAAAGDTVVFVAGRLVEGVGGAAVLAATLGLLAQAFPAGPDRARAAAMWGASVGAGT